MTPASDGRDFSRLNVKDAFRRGAACRVMTGIGRWLQELMPKLGLNQAGLARWLGLHEAGIGRVIRYQQGVAMENAIHLLLVVDQLRRARRLDVPWPSVLSPTYLLVRGGYQSALRYVAWRRQAAGTDLSEEDLPYEDLAYLGLIVKDKDASLFVEQERHERKLQDWLRADGRCAALQARVSDLLGFPASARRSEALIDLIHRRRREALNMAAVDLKLAPAEWEIVALYLLEKEYSRRYHHLRREDRNTEAARELSLQLCGGLRVTDVADRAPEVERPEGLFALLDRWRAAWFDVQYALHELDDSRGGGTPLPLWSPLP